MMDEMGDNLIFLITLPRSGSTLLQHVLASHAAIHTLPEPWLMLHLVYGLKQEDLTAPYNARLSGRALAEFLKHLPHGRETYITGIRSMANVIYNDAMNTSSGKRYFLDKTTRYYMILKELLEIFPQAKFVFLLRNPLAIFSSVMNTSLRGDFRGFFTTDRKSDLLQGPPALIEGFRRLGDRAHVVRYEELVTGTEQVLEKLCAFLEIPFDREMSNYGNKVQFENSGFVDPKSIYHHQRPVAGYADQWPERLDTAQKQHLALGYLHTLGKNTIESLGYDYEELDRILHRLQSRHLLPVAQWSLLAADRENLDWAQKMSLMLCTNLQLAVWRYRRYGLKRAIQRAFGLLVGGMRPGSGN